MARLNHLQLGACGVEIFPTVPGDNPQGVVGGLQHTARGQAVNRSARQGRTGFEPQEASDTILMPLYSYNKVCGLLGCELFQPFQI